MTIEAPPVRAFVADGDDTWVRVRAKGAEAAMLSVDGGDPVPMMRDEDGKFLAALPLAAGRHELLVTVPGVAGAVAERTVFVGRAAASPVAGFDVSRAGTRALVLSDAAPGAGGLYEGTMSVLTMTTASAPFDTGASRVLSREAVYGEATDEGRVTWVDAWKGERGTLHLAEIDGAGDPIASVPRVRDFKFGRDGRTLGALDDGVVVIGPADGEVKRVAATARAFVFAGVGSDVVAFSGESGSNARTATLASAPGYEPVVLAPPVLPIIASSTSRREAALLEYVDGGYGDLVLYDFSTLEAARPFSGVSGFVYSRDGNVLLALVDSGSGSASVGVLRRDEPSPAPAIFPGEFVQAGFDASGTRVYALEPEATLPGESHGTLALRVANLGDVEPAFTTIASHIADFLALPDDRMLLLTAGGELAIVEPDGAVLELGEWNPERKQVSLSRDGATFAFTAIDGDRRPIRRVNLLTGTMGDLGENAQRPIALDGGAVAWAESKGAGLAGSDLWILPTFPAALNGPRPIAADVSTSRPFAVSPDGVHFAAIAGNAVHCGDAGGHLTALGATDARRRDVFFLADGRVGRFGIDGPEEQVLFFQRCP